jgi:two-component system NtrC family sensor kinase
MNFITKNFFPKNSIRLLLIVWFLLFALVPLSFITGYSLVQFEKVYSDQTLKRLNDNFVLVQKRIEDLNQYLKSSAESHVADPTLSFYISTRNLPQLKRMGNDWLRVGYIDEVSFFNKDAEQLTSLKKDTEGFIVEQDKSGYVLNPQLLARISSESPLVVRDINTEYGFDLISYTKVINNKGRLDGYLQEIVRVDHEFIKNLKTRYALDFFILDKDFRPVKATDESFMSIRPDIFKRGSFENVKYVELQSKGVSYAVLVKSLDRDNKIYLGVATSRDEIIQTTGRINRAVFSVVAVVIVFVLIVIWIVSRKVFGPLNSLIQAVKKLEGGENPYIVHESSTEIGELTKSFNEMSKKVTHVQAELTNKVRELELANKELQEAQSQLVHSAKMSSLGQVVAGVAHELNNPIGFIYSNMNHLREYSQQLIDAIHRLEKDPSRIEDIKKEIDFEYLQKDLPQLIKSCEDGAKRVRDIVLNLRNFSRTDENDRKEFNLEEGLESTLSILSSDIKNRIQIHREYGNIPTVYCYPGQINQVFMNIITNAIQSIDGKGDIWIKTEKKGLEVHISIRDSGKGIPPEIQEKIFDPFFTTKPVGQGTGLGLSISYGIIQKHKGQIKVSSQPGQGTTFTIILSLI